MINKPDVYRAPGSDSYVIFGEAKVEDASASLQADAAAQFARPAAGARPGAGGIPSAAPADDDEGDDDATGVEDKDIQVRLAAETSISAVALDATCPPLLSRYSDYLALARSLSRALTPIPFPSLAQLVMDQAGVDRSKAIKALKKNNSDIVSAIMDLTLAS